MKKRIIISLMIIIALALVLLLPILGESYDDGGTREYNALTYKIVVWNKMFVVEDESGEQRSATYQNTSVYWYPDNQKSIDELWEIEKTLATLDALINQNLRNRRIWDRYHPDYAEPVTGFSTRVPEFDNALIEYKEDCKIYVDGEYFLGDAGAGCESFYLSDLTGDGRPELCFGMNMGSGMISSQIEIIDYATKDKIFSLSDRGTHDYYLFLRDKVLCVKETEYSKQDAIRTGVLAYNGSEVSVIWDAEANDSMDP